MNYSLERENNIIKNIAREIFNECTQTGVDVTQDLAEYMVKLKMLNPKNGFTASEVMPRSLTQQLVLMVTEDLRQNTPAMNCIRMQVYWSSIKLNVADTKKDYFASCTEKGEPYLNEILNLEKEDDMKFLKQGAAYVLSAFNMGNPGFLPDLRETTSAFHSIFKTKEISYFTSLSNEEKIQQMTVYGKMVTGIRLYLKYLGKAGEGVENVNLNEKLEDLRREIWQISEKLTSKAEDIRDVLWLIFPTNYFTLDFPRTPQNVTEFLPSECDENDLKYSKQILLIMLQHRDYLSDLLSKLEEIDGEAYFFLKELQELFQKLQTTIRDREAVPTVEVYGDFEKIGEVWMEIQAYSYCITVVQNISRTLESFNKKNYFSQTMLEKLLSITSSRHRGSGTNKKSSSAIALQENEELHIEFNGYCAWTLYFNEGLLIPGDSKHGLQQYQSQYYIFSNKFAYDFFAMNPHHCLMEIYEYLRNNPEMIRFLNAYDNLYHVRNSELTKKVDWKVSIRSATNQTDLHPIPEYWDKDYTFSLWELKKRALEMSRLVKCVTKSVQTVNPHSHFRATIGILAAPDKDKEAQTKKDSCCNHPAVANYLYGLRGHKEDKFRVIQLTRPVDESFEKQIVLSEEDPCRERQREKTRQETPQNFTRPPCPPRSSHDK